LLWNSNDHWRICTAIAQRRHGVARKTDRFASMIIIALALLPVMARFA
jgi:hypothetical protein